MCDVLERQSFDLLHELLERLLMIEWMMAMLMTTMMMKAVERHRVEHDGRGCCPS